jgi:phosphotriesterase-related protein
MFLPTDRRNATTAELLRRGHADRVHISQDYCATIDWFPEEAAQQLIDAGLIEGWSMTLVFDEVLPRLREEGVLDEATERTIFVDNPRRWMAGE